MNPQNGRQNPKNGPIFWPAKKIENVAKKNGKANAFFPRAWPSQPGTQKPPFTPLFKANTKIGPALAQPAGNSKLRKF